MGADTVKRGVLGLLLAWPLATPAGPAPGDAAPDFALKATSGENLRLSEYRGQVVLLTFWAEWCGRCTLQLDALAGLQQRLGNEALQVLTINIDREDGPAAEAARRHGLPVLRDPSGTVARQYDLRDLPLALLLDPSGQVRHVHEEYGDGDAARYEAELTALLRE